MSILTTLQQQIADRLSSDPFFASVPIFTERIKNLQSEIQLALGPLNGRSGKSGLAIVILTPTANVNFGEIYGPFFDDIRITIRVIENVTQNQDADTGSGIPAAAAAEMICNVLHQFLPDSATSPIIARKPTMSLVDDPVNLIYHCRLRTAGGPQILPPQLPSPSHGSSQGGITLSCAIAGAAIFYTLDGSNPSPRNPTAILYLEPFASSAGLTLRARAFLAGYLASEVLIATI